MSTKHKNCGIYCYRNIINGKKYIGQSVNLYLRRMQFGKGHRYSGKLFDNAVKKYGKENFQYSILTHCKPEELNYFEQFYISRLKTCDRRYGYNCTTGGDSQYFRTEEAKKNMSESWTEERKLKQSKKQTGVKNNNFGHKWCDELKKRVSDKRKESFRKRFLETHGYEFSELGPKINEYIQSNQNTNYTEVAKHFKVCLRIATSICKEYGLTTEISSQRHTNKSKKAVVQCDVNDHNIIYNIFPSISDAIAITGMDSFRHCLYGGQTHAYGYFWRFATENEKPYEHINTEYLKPTELYHKVFKKI